MGGDAQVQGAQAAVHEEAVQRAGDGADGVLDEAHLLVQRGVLHDDGAADGVGVAAEVLGRRVHDRAGAELQRSLDRGGGEGVVHGHQGVARALDDGGDVHDVEQRVRRGLDPDEPRLGRTARSTASRSVWSTMSYSRPEAAEDLVDQPVGAPVEIEREDHVIAAPSRRP